MVRPDTDDDDDDDYAFVELDEKEDQLATALQDMMSPNNDFQSAGPPLSTWYGLRCFLVLNPSNDPVVHESKIKLLISSINIAIANTSCTVPVFVEAHKPWRNVYYGQCESVGLRTSYEMIHLERVPRQYYHLSGLLDLFKGKLACPVSPFPPVTLSVMLTYCLKDWKDYAWTHVPLDYDMIQDESHVTLRDLPMGAGREPLSMLYLSTTWLALSEEMIVDNDNYTDLDPLQAPDWSVLVKMTDDAHCLLDEFVSNFQSICLSGDTMEQLLGRWMDDDDSDPQTDFGQVLQKLTEPVPYYIPTLTDVVSKAATATRIHVKQKEAILSMDLLNDILLYLFPDAKDDDGPPSADDDNIKNSTIVSLEYKDVLKQWKSAPVHSLTHKLAVCLCIVNTTYGGIKAVAHLWQEFVYEMRYRWENATLIPDITSESPDLANCLLHQKLQMLNCCIVKKRQREAAPQSCDVTESAASSPLTSSVFTEPGTPCKRLRPEKTVSSSDSDDDFFECKESLDTSASIGTKTKQRRRSLPEVDNNKAEKTPPSSKSLQNFSDLTRDWEDGEEAAMVADDVTESSQTSSIPVKPEGRKELCEDLRLLNVDEALYIPYTQDPAPLTEDMLDEQLEIMSKLGTSAEAAHRRALMQSGSLLSDMESFKAANPGCVLEDFVRWYSPRDYEETVTEKDGETIRTGELSARMRIPGNMWVDCWQTARPVPTRRQKRLFDDTKEAEKVLHFLSSMRPAEVAQHLMPMVITAAVIKLLELEENERVPLMARLLKQISACTVRSHKVRAQHYAPLVALIRDVETLIARAHSLRSKFYEHSPETADSVKRRSSRVGTPDGSSSSSSRESGTDEAREEKRVATKKIIEEFVSALVEQKDVRVEGAARSTIGKMLHKMFVAAQRASHMLPDDMNDTAAKLPSSVPDFPEPVAKNFILRTTAPRPAPYSRPSPQRLFCAIREHDVRFAGAFTVDTTFI